MIGSRAYLGQVVDRAGGCAKVFVGTGRLVVEVKGQLELEAVGAEVLINLLSRATRRLEGGPEPVTLSWPASP